MTSKGTTNWNSPAFSKLPLLSTNAPRNEIEPSEVTPAPLLRSPVLHTTTSTTSSTGFDIKPLLRPLVSKPTVNISPQKPQQLPTMMQSPLKPLITPMSPLTNHNISNNPNHDRTSILPRPSPSIPQSLPPQVPLQSLPLPPLSRPSNVATNSPPRHGLPALVKAPLTMSPTKLNNNKPNTIKSTSLVRHAEPCDPVNAPINSTATNELRQPVTTTASTSILNSIHLKSNPTTPTPSVNSTNSNNASTAPSDNPFPQFDDIDDVPSRFQWARIPAKPASPKKADPIQKSAPTPSHASATNVSNNNSKIGNLNQPATVAPPTANLSRTSNYNNANSNPTPTAQNYSANVNIPGTTLQNNLPNPTQSSSRVTAPMTNFSAYKYNPSASGGTQISNSDGAARSPASNASKAASASTQNFPIFEFQQRWQHFFHHSGEQMPDNFGNFPGFNFHLNSYFHLVDNDSFAISISLKEIPPECKSYLDECGYYYDKRTCWVFPVVKHNEVHAIFKHYGLAHVKPLPANILNVFRAKNDRLLKLPPSEQPAQQCMQVTLANTKSTGEEISDLSARVPKNLLNTLMPFQLEGLKYVIRHEGRALIGDEMGLGKTFQGLSFAAYYRNEWPVLVVSPSSLMCQWAEVFEDWIEGLPYDQINIVEKSKNFRLKLVNIVSYNLVSKLKSQLAKIRVIVCDESHYIKNWKATRTVAVTDLVRQASRAVLLTGTPALSRPSELFTQLQALYPKIFVFPLEFCQRYCNDHVDRFGKKDSKGSSNLRELYLFAAEVAMIRRKKDHVLTDLPKKSRAKILIDIPSNAKKLMKKINDDLSALKDQLEDMIDKSKDSDELNEGMQESGFDFHHIRLVNEMFRDTGRAKLISVLQYLDESFFDLGADMPKVIIFAIHQDILDAIQLAMTKKKIKFMRICGKTHQSARKALVDQFQNDPTCKVALLSLLAGGVGLTLTASSTVVFCELYWNPGHLVQAEDRAHRIGQTRGVDVRYLVAKNTIDETIWRMVQKKLSVVGSAIDGNTADVNLGANSIRSEIDADKIKPTKFVNLVMEKLDNYDERKNRMIRLQGLREGSLELLREPGEDVEDSVDQEDFVHSEYGGLQFTSARAAMDGYAYQDDDADSEFAPASLLKNNKRKLVLSEEEDDMVVISDVTPSKAMSNVSSHSNSNSSFGSASGARTGDGLKQQQLTMPMRSNQPANHSKEKPSTVATIAGTHTRKKQKTTSLNNAGTMTIELKDSSESDSDDSNSESDSDSVESMKRKFRKVQQKTSMRLQASNGPLTSRVASTDAVGLKINLSRDVSYEKQLEEQGIKSTALSRLQKFQMR